MGLSQESRSSTDGYNQLILSKLMRMAARGNRKRDQTPVKVPWFCPLNSHYIYM